MNFELEKLTIFIQINNTIQILYNGFLGTLVRISISFFMSCLRIILCYESILNSLRGSIILDIEAHGSRFKEN